MLDTPEQGGDPRPEGLFWLLIGGRDDPCADPPPKGQVGLCSFFLAFSLPLLWLFAVPALLWAEQLAGCSGGSSGCPWAASRWERGAGVGTGGLVLVPASGTGQHGHILGCGSAPAVTRNEPGPGRAGGSGGHGRAWLGWGASGVSGERLQAPW